MEKNAFMANNVRLQRGLGITRKQREQHLNLAGGDYCVENEYKRCFNLCHQMFATGSKQWRSGMNLLCLNVSTRIPQDRTFTLPACFLTDPSVNPTVILQRVFDETPSTGNCSFVISQRGTDTRDHTQVLALPCGATLFLVSFQMCTVNQIIIFSC